MVDGPIKKKKGQEKKRGAGVVRILYDLEDSDAKLIQGPRQLPFYITCLDETCADSIVGIVGGGVNYNYPSALHTAVAAK